MYGKAFLAVSSHHLQSAQVVRSTSCTRCQTSAPPDGRSHCGGACGLHSLCLVCWQQRKIKAQTHRPKKKKRGCGGRVGSSRSLISGLIPMAIDCLNTTILILFYFFLDLIFQLHVHRVPSALGESTTFSHLNSENSSSL